MKDKSVDVSKMKTLDFDATWKISDTKAADGSCIIEGYANTVDKDRVGDVVLPEAFKNTLETYNKNPVLLFQHNWEKVIGRVSECVIDEKGLKIKGIISKAKDVEDVRTKINEGILKTLSIGYNEVVSEYDEAKCAKVIKQLELLEISVVTIPANVEASFTVVGGGQQEPDESGDKSLSLEGKFEELANEFRGMSDCVKQIMKESKMSLKDKSETPPVLNEEHPKPEGDVPAVDKPAMDDEMKGHMKIMAEKTGEMLEVMKEMLEVQKSAKKADEKPKEEEELEKPEEEKPEEEKPEEEKSIEALTDEQAEIELEKTINELENLEN